MSEKLFSDEIRARERKRRRREPLWGLVSFILHTLVFAAIILLTPVKSLMFEEKKEKANPAADLSAERIEQIADALSQARINELLRQLEALQAVLHNMDLMKEELQRDYDSFAASSAEDIKVTLGKIIDEAEQAQQKAVGAQGPMIEMVAKMVAEEKLDLTDEQRSKFLRDSAGSLMIADGDSVADAQAVAGNAFDRVQVQAEFAGYRKTSEASEKVRDAQIEAATMQNQAQKEASEIAWKMGDYRSRTATLARRERNLAETQANLAKAEQERTDAEVKLAESSKLRDLAEKERGNAYADERSARETANKASEEAKRERSEADRLRRELSEAKKQLKAARIARDNAERKAKGGGK
jgi:hypothetical protein